MRLLLVLMAAGALVTLLTFGARALIAELSVIANGLSGELPTVLDRIRAALSRIPYLGERLFGSEAFSHLLSSLITNLPPFVSRLARTLPTFLFSLGVSVLAAVYFCLDLDRVHAALGRIIPTRIRPFLSEAKRSALRAALSALRAELLLMLIAFFVMLFGFLILGLPYPFLLAALLALFDLLPVIGVGTFLLPWGFLALLSGARTLGVGILIIFGVTALLRQFAEPHLLGRRMGVHPLLTLLSLYAGFRLLGAVGMILFPVLTLLVYGALFDGVAEKGKEEK